MAPVRYPFSPNDASILAKHGLEGCSIVGVGDVPNKEVRVCWIGLRHLSSHWIGHRVAYLIAVNGAGAQSRLGQAPIWFRPGSSSLNHWDMKFPFPRIFHFRLIKSFDKEQAPGQGAGALSIISGCRALKVFVTDYSLEAFVTCRNAPR